MCFKTKCNEQCFKLKCSCKLPIISLQHIQIKCSCGTSSLYHVLCISDATKCIHCNKSFSIEIMFQIKTIKKQIIEDIQKHKLRQRKQTFFRKQLQQKITQQVLPFLLKEC